MKRYLWVVEIKYSDTDWDVYEAPEINTRQWCRGTIAREKSWHNLPYPKYRIRKYVPQEKAK